MPDKNPDLEFYEIEADVELIGSSTERLIPGPPGKDGFTPFIGENDNWWIGDIDTGVRAEGKQGDKGEQGEQGEKGEIGECTQPDWEEENPTAASYVRNRPKINGVTFVGNKYLPEYPLTNTELAQLLV